MPIYEYQCIQCGQKFEVHQSIDEDGSSLSCPKCHAGKPKRLLSSFYSRGSSEVESSDVSCPTCNTGGCGLPPM